MSNNNLDNKQNFIFGEEVDLKEFLKLLFRNKLLISLSGIIFFIFACIFALIQKRVWEGNFEIVLEDSNKQIASKIRQNNSMDLFSNLNLFNGNSNLNTEVAILKTPSVLFPIYDFVNNERRKDDPNFQEIPFKKWKKNYLKIELIPGTSILNIIYKDSDKEIILPVLNRISSAYQIYSGKRTKRDINLAKDYLNNQIFKYRQQSSLSLKNAQEFASDQDLTMISLENFSADKELDNIDIEKIRVQSANNIRKIDQQINRIVFMTDELDELEFIGRSTGLKKDRISEELNKIESELIEAKSKYHENDEIIKRMEERRKLFIKLLKKRTIGFLKAKRIVEKANMESARRPKNVILKYKELIRKAGRDEATLIELENQLRFINLEEARYKDPWELVTKPTLKKSPVGPKRKRIGIIGFILGLIGGTGFAIFKEIKSNIVYNQEDVEKILKSPIFKIIKVKGNNIEDNKNLLSLDEISSINDKNLNIIYMNNFSPDNLSMIKEYLTNSFKKIENKPSKNLIFHNSNCSNLNKKDTYIVLVNMLNLKYSELKYFQKKLEYLNIQALGIILIS